MVNAFDIRRASRIWWARILSLVVCLGAGSDSLSAQARLPTPPALPLEAEVALMRTPGEICVRTGEPLEETLIGVRAPLVGYLLDELIAQRLENAQLNADLADAKAQRAQIEKAAREKEAALAAQIGGLHEEAAHREARASRARLLEEARVAEASARARRQLAAMKNKLKEQDRQMAVSRFVAEDLAQRLSAAEDELKRVDAVNRAAIEAQIRVLHTASEDTLPEWPERSAEVLSVTPLGVFPAMPHPKPRLQVGEVEAWALASDMAAGETSTPGEAHMVMEEGAWIQAGLRNVAVRDWEPTSDTTPFSAPDSPETPDIMSTAALAPTPFISRMLAPGESSPTGLDEAAARLADGLRATREEAMLQQQERVFTVDVEKRAFVSSAGKSVPLDPALDLRLLTVKSELVGESKGRIRFFPNGSSTGGRIELGFLSDRAAVNVRWSTGAVTLEHYTDPAVF